MEAKERLILSLQSQKLDRIPWVPLVFGAAYALTNSTLKDYLYQPELMYQGQKNAQKILGSDALFVFGDNALEAEALGCKLDYSRPYYPYVAKPLFKEWKPSDTLPDLQYDSSLSRLEVLLEACSRMKRNAEEQAVIGCVAGPVTIASELMGAEEFLYFAADTPEYLTSLLAATCQVSLDWAQSLYEAGADGVIVNDPCASPSFLPAKYYRRWIFSEHQILFKRMEQLGIPIRWLIVTGNTLEILEDLDLTGANVITLDYLVSLPKARSRMHQCLAGNLKPHLFGQNTSEELVKETQILLQNNWRKDKFWFSTGCEIPLETSWNMLDKLEIKDFLRISGVNQS